MLSLLTSELHYGDLHMHMSNEMKTGMDTLSFVTIVASFASWLPPAAAFASLVWTLIRIWETKTVQSWLNRRKLQKCINCPTRGASERV